MRALRRRGGRGQHVRPLLRAIPLGGRDCRDVATLEQTVQLVPCADLWFTPDDAAIDFIRALR